MCVYVCVRQGLEWQAGAPPPFVREGSEEDAGEVVVVADMSSNLFTKRLDISKFGLIYACAQVSLIPLSCPLSPAPS